MRHLAIVVAFVVGACAGTTVHTIAQDAAPAAVKPAPTTPALGATVVHMDKAEQRQVGGGKAKVWMLARGANAFIARLELVAGFKVPEHRDATEEYIHVLRGSGALTIDGKVHQLKTGSTVFMPANALVSYVNGPEPLVGLQVFAGPAPADKYNTWHVVQ